MKPHSCQASTHQRGCPPAILPVKTREQQKHYDTDLRRNNRRPQGRTSRRERWQTLLLLDGRQRTGDRSRSCHPPHRWYGRRKDGTILPREKISLLVDAAHPFAIRLHRTLAKVSSRLRIPVVRLERQYPAHDKRLIWCTDYAAAIDRLRADGICNLLALTGVKTIAKLRPYWEQTPCWFRILNRKESLSLAESDGFPKERIIFSMKEKTRRSCWTSFFQMPY